MTDGYRPEVIKQQTAVRETGPVDNDYWVSNSAVLSATADRAAMLMLLQGQRGAAGQQRFISASVRVDFEKLGGAWKVANLTVLAPPRPSPPAKPEAKQDSSTSEPAAPKPSAPKPAAPKPSTATPKPGAATPKPAPPKPSAAAPSPSAGGR